MSSAESAPIAAAAAMPSDDAASVVATVVAAATDDHTSSTSTMCDNCDHEAATTYCQQCNSTYCAGCDSDIHKPVKQATHNRTATSDSFKGSLKRTSSTTGGGAALAAGAAKSSAPSNAPSNIANIIQKCQEEGVVSDYSASRPDGTSVLKYVLEYSQGYYYLYRNLSKDIHLDVDLSFTLTNLRMMSFEPGATRVRVCLPPGSDQYVHLRRVDAKAACDCGITQRFALTNVTEGSVKKKSAVYVPVLYTADSPLDVLEAQTESEGSRSTHGASDPRGLLIVQVQWEFTGGYCFLWLNDSDEMLFHKEIEFDLTNLAMMRMPSGKAYKAGGSAVVADAAPSNKVVVDLAPGERKFIVMTEVEPKKEYGVGVRAGFTLTKKK